MNNGWSKDEPAKLNLDEIEDVGFIKFDLLGGGQENAIALMIESWSHTLSPGQPENIPEESE